MIRSNSFLRQRLRYSCLVLVQCSDINSWAWLANVSKIRSQLVSSLSRINSFTLPLSLKTVCYCHSLISSVFYDRSSTGIKLAFDN